MNASNSPSPIHDLYTNRVDLYEWMIRLSKYKEALTRLFISRSLPQDGMRVLDAGCGTGEVTRAVIESAKKRNANDVHYYGFDFTPAMLERFKQWAHDSNQIVNVVPADALDLPKALPDDWKNFDLIVSSGMLEYLPKNRIVEALHSLRLLLEKLGILQVFISRKGGLSGFIIKNLWKAELYSRAELQSVFHEAGFTSIDITPFHIWGYSVTASSK